MTFREPEAAELVKRLRALSRHEHTDLTIGDEAADRLEAITRELTDRDEVIADKRRLAREINKALDGTDSESMCDAVGVAERVESALAEARQKLGALEAANERACSLRSDDAYAALIACPGMTDALYALDEARADARANLAKDKTHG